MLRLLLVVQTDASVLAVAYFWEGVFTELLHSNGNYSIVACVFVAAGICLSNCCREMNIHSDFTIPAFGRHVTILISDF
jgi:hypothetical protein